MLWRIFVGPTHGFGRHCRPNTEIVLHSVQQKGEIAVRTGHTRKHAAAASPHTRAWIRSLSNSATSQYLDLIVTNTKVLKEDSGQTAPRALPSPSLKSIRGFECRLRRQKHSSACRSPIHGESFPLIKVCSSLDRFHDALLVVTNMFSLHRSAPLIRPVPIEKRSPSSPPGLPNLVVGALVLPTWKLPLRTCASVADHPPTA